MHVYACKNLVKINKGKGKKERLWKKVNTADSICVYMVFILTDLTQPIITWKESQWMTLGWPEDMSMGDCLKLTDVGRYSPLVSAPLAGAGRWYGGKVVGVCVCIMKCVRVGTASWTQASKQHPFISPCSWFWVCCDCPTMMPGYFIIVTELKQVVWPPHSWLRKSD